MYQSSSASREAARERPGGQPLMHHTWKDLLFLHWAFDPDGLRRLVPAPLEIDTFDGQAYVGITPFDMRNVRPNFLPPVPWLSDFHEINCRTYVTLDGEPGVWFFSLDTDSSLTVLGARTIYALPYYHSEMSAERRGPHHVFNSKRSDGSAMFGARWSVAEDTLPRRAGQGSLEHFLVERYCLFTWHLNEIYRCRIHHEPWQLSPASVEWYATTLFEAAGLPTPTVEPIVHFGNTVNVEVWPIEKARVQRDPELSSTAPSAPAEVVF
jgi:uncharacterized protein